MKVNSFDILNLRIAFLTAGAPDRSTQGLMMQSNVSPYKANMKALVPVSREYFSNVQYSKLYTTWKTIVLNANKNTAINPVLAVTKFLFLSLKYLEFRNLGGSVKLQIEKKITQFPGSNSVLCLLRFT